ncbi:MAG: hypothetical protein O2840_03305 [bacterium]|nr:hypothetical protein [bacterium]
MQKHQSDTTRTTVTIPTYLYMHYKRQAVEQRKTFGELLVDQLKKQVLPERIDQGQIDCLGPLIAATEQAVLQDQNGAKNSPSDLSENYKKYLYSKDAQ